MIDSKTPMERCCELVEAVPLQEEVEALYNVKTERTKIRDFLADQRLAELKGCL